jgi:hypothetical protein
MTALLEMDISVMLFIIHWKVKYWKKEKVSGCMGKFPLLSPEPALLI